MTTRTWNGSSGNFTDAGSWSPTGVPASGDTAIINAGTVNATGVISGVTIDLTEASGSSVSTTLSLSNVTLAGASSLVVTNSQMFTTAAAPIINVSGTSTLAGTNSFYGNKIQFSIAAGSTLVNSGIMNFYSSSPYTLGGGTLQNNGTIALVNPNNGPQVPDLADPITGTGMIALGEHGRLQIDGAVGSGQTILLNDGASGSESLQLNSAATFAGTINGFSASDNLYVINTPYTSATYTSTGASSGTLNLFSGTTLEASLNFLGQYSLASFSLSNTNLGNGQNNLQITTTAVNSQSGGLPSGFQNGGSGTLPVYRFFDKNTGTHFFTADVGERNSTLGLSNYTEETNDFGAVAQGAPSAEAVYRFFDTKYGTHFFTASASERDTVIATRPDLTYEPSSTFYEDATQQTGDVAVYRFFDTQFGTHFYTGDAGEAATTTNLLNAAGQHQFTAEGVGFYAPAGSFT